MYTNRAMPAVAVTWIAAGCASFAVTDAEFVERMNALLGR